MNNKLTKEQKLELLISYFNDLNDYYELLNRAIISKNNELAKYIKKEMLEMIENILEEIEEIEEL